MQQPWRLFGSHSLLEALGSWGSCEPAFNPLRTFATVAFHPFRIAYCEPRGDTRAMVVPLRVAGFVALTLSFGIHQIAAACTVESPPPPTPRAASESEGEFAARRDRWYRDIAERQRQEALPGMAAEEDRLWATARRIVLARIESVGSTHLRGSEGRRYESPLVTLRPVRWLRGSSSARRLSVHYLSDGSCDFGGAGDAPEGEVGDVFLLFYGPGSIDPRSILDTLDRDRAVTQRSRDAFDLEVSLTSSSDQTT